MTISLLHYNPATGLSASISATGGVSVGGYVNHSWRGLGGCATQGFYTNPWYPNYIKEALIGNQSSKDIINQLIKKDKNFQLRQCLVIDDKGESSVLNGTQNTPFISSLSFPHFAVAGNMLTGPQVLENMSNTFAQASFSNPEDVLQQKKPIYNKNYENDLPEVLIQSLEAALNAGGDMRGTYSASMRIERYHNAPIDIRVDWADTNLIEQMRFILTKVNHPDFQQFLKNLPNDDLVYTQTS